MLPKIYRLNVKNFYHNTHTQRIIRERFCEIRIKNHETQSPKLAVTVPKVIEKRAVYRNRTRRLIYEWAYPILSKSTQPLDVVVRPKKIILKGTEDEAKLFYTRIFNLIFHP
jgi:ribonuclease P protein component